MSARFKFLDNLPEEEGPALAEGARVHALCYQYIQGRIGLPPELERFREEFIALRAAGALVEREWAFDPNWGPCDWWTGWVRIKVDAITWAEPVLTVIDFKTGAPRAEDIGQLELYALGGMLLWDKVEIVEARCWYLTDGVYGPKDGPLLFARQDIEGLKERWGGRAAPMLADTTFAATPGRHCRFCSYAAPGPCRYDREGMAVRESGVGA